MKYENRNSKTKYEIVSNNKDHDHIKNTCFSRICIFKYFKIF